MTNYIFTVWSVAAWLDWLYFLTNEWEVFMIKYGWKTPTTRRTRIDNLAPAPDKLHILGWTKLMQFHLMPIWLFHLLSQCAYRLFHVSTLALYWEERKGRIGHREGLIISMLDAWIWLLSSEFYLIKGISEQQSYLWLH